LFPLLLTGIAITIVVVALELASRFLIVNRNHNVYLPLDLQRLPEALSDNDSSEHFSAELGWEMRYPNAAGYRGEEKDVGRAALAVFGDSFTQGHPWLEGSWPYLLERRLGRPVLNFGVGAYGTDQAYLRFRMRYVDKLSTPYVALCVQSENIARIVNVYRGFYVRGTRVDATKPRFELTESGALALIPNPVRRYEDLARLSDMQFLRDLGEKDYWYRHFDAHGLNRHINFPYSIGVLKALPFYANRIIRNRIGNESAYKALYEDDEATRLLAAIIAAFIGDAEASGTVPIIVFFPNRIDLNDYARDHSTVYENFYGVTGSRHPHVFDGLKYFKPLIDGGLDVERFFQPRIDGHYNLLAERLVTDGVFDDLCRVDRQYGTLGVCRD
jgi:hypothetical protein